MVPIPRKPNNQTPYIVLMTDYCNILLATQWRLQVAPKRWYQPTYYIHANSHLHTHYVGRQPTALHCPVDDAISQNRLRYNFIAAQIGLHFMSVIYKAPPPTPLYSQFHFISVGLPHHLTNPPPLLQ